MVAGVLAPDAGAVTLGASLKMGYFAQQALDLLDPDLTIEEQLQKDFPHESIGVLRSLAGAFQFSGDDIDKKIRALSGGEKTRLVMARMLLDPPNFLVLDEPTNHLDLATKEMLIEALKDFEGTMLFVSHDRAFLRGLSNRVLELGGESGTDREPHLYPGSYVEYVQRTGHEAPGVHTDRSRCVRRRRPLGAPGSCRALKALPSSERLDPQRPLEQHRRRGHRDRREDDQIAEVAGDGLEAGVLEQQALERVHGVGERIDHGDRLHPAAGSPAADRRRRSGSRARC